MTPMVRWDDDAKRAVMAMRAEGKPASRIAEAMTERFGVPVSRNAVLGLVDRLLRRSGARAGAMSKEQAGRAGGTHKKQGVAARNRRGVTRIAPPVASGFVERDGAVTVDENELPMLAGPVLSLALVELSAGQCRFSVTPHGAVPADHRFCGLPAQQGRPYCAHHAALCAGRGTWSERDALRTLKRQGGRS